MNGSAPGSRNRIFLFNCCFSPLKEEKDQLLAGYSDGETPAEYDYDEMGRKTWERVNYGPFSKEYSYTYYGNGLKYTFTAPDSTVYTYLYGLNNELQDVQIPGLGSMTIPNYTWNRPATVNYPGGTQKTYGYDALMRLQSFTVLDPTSTPLLDYTYTYDEVGNILTKTTEHGNYTYGYDAMSRLITADNPALADEAYTYDNVGNRFTSADVSGSWNYNLNNELLGYADMDYEYDENGNMTQIAVAGQVVWTYVYDAANRLVHVEDGTGTIAADYYYDPFGRRLWKDVGGVRTYFFYSEEGLIAEYDVSGTEIRSYGYKPDSTWTTDPLWLKEGGSYYWYQNDHLGTPQKLTATDGTVVWSAQYTAFGEADVQVETVVNNLRFPGQYEDTETGLHYNYHRYYDPKVGRYISVDPIGHREGKNLFSYALNNPGKETDPLGLWVHPPQIIPPQEAVDWVKQIQREASRDLWWKLRKVKTAKFLGMGDFKERLLITLILNNEEALKNGGYVLGYQALANWPGGMDPEWHNRFVFTCKYGWIDMGHFFQTATLGYWRQVTGLNPGFDLFWIIGGEIVQSAIFVIEPLLPKNIGNQAQSAFTPEDPWSNFQGNYFGVGVAMEGSGDVAGAWKQFLKNSGAVAFTQEDTYHDLLRQDVERWWNDDGPYTGEYSRYTGPRGFWDEVKHESKAYCLLCDGGTPKFGIPTY